MAKHGLGRGLDALIKDASPPEDTGADGSPLTVPVDRVCPNPFQPRREFRPEALSDLIGSISEHGMLQPLVVRRKGNDFELIAGERRLRAATQAGLKEVPVVVRDVEDRDALGIALVENLQREDLNPVEEAEGYHVLMKKFKLTQEDVSARVGKGRATVANAVRLLDLPEEVKGFLRKGALSTGHAKALLSIDKTEQRVVLARRAVKENLSVRALERIARKATSRPRRKRVYHEDMPASHVQYISDRLHQAFGTSIRLSPCRTLPNGRKAKGCLEIDFFSNEDLNRILDVMGLESED